jgi:NRPS condensation-like uncharacterized protein
MFMREASALDLFTDSVRTLGDATLCGVMEFGARLDPGALGKAAEACLAAHPILHSRLVRGNGPAQWEMTGAVHLSPVAVEKCGECYHPCVIGPVDPYGPQQARFRLLRRPDGDVAVINLSHAAADAFGLSSLMSQLLQEMIEPGSVLPAEGGIPVRDTLWTRSLAGAENAEKNGVKVINPMWPDPFGTSRSPSSFHRGRIEPQVLERIRAEAGRSAGSINDAVMAAYFLAMSDLTGFPGPIDIFFPVNLRRYLDDGSRVMSNQAANVSFPMERNPGERMDEILPRVVGQVKALKKNGIGLPEQAAMDALSDPEGLYVEMMVREMEDMQKSGLADIFISNPGPFVLPDMEGLEDAYICYPGVYMPTTCFVTSTFRGRMTVTMGYQDSRRAREGTRKAMDLFFGYLMTLADG